MLRVLLPAAAVCAVAGVTGATAAAPAGPQLPSGCTLERLPADASPKTDEERGCFNDWADSKRLLRFGVPDCCGGPDSFCPGDVYPPGMKFPSGKAEKCDSTKMSPELCGAMCYALGVAKNKDKKPFLLAGSVSPTSYQVRSLVCSLFCPSARSCVLIRLPLQCRVCGSMLLRQRQEPCISRGQQAGAAFGMQHGLPRQDPKF